MRDYQDLERGSPIKIRWPGTTQTAEGTVAKLPPDLSAPVEVILDGKRWKFDQADTTNPGEPFPPLPDYRFWTPDTPVYYRKDDGTVVEGRLVRPPDNPVSGSALFTPLGESEAYEVPVYRLQSDPDDYNPFRLTFFGQFLTYQGRILTFGA